VAQDFSPADGREVEHCHVRSITSGLYRCWTVAVLVDDVVCSLTRVIEELLALLEGSVLLIAPI
jgi:hypothetical protein